jgi:hypothetical protein
MTIKRLFVGKVPFRRPRMGLRHRVAPAWAAAALGLLAATGGLSASASAASTPAALGGHFTASNNGVDFGTATLGDYVTASSRAAQVVLYNNDEMTNAPNSVTSIDITGPDSDDFVAQSTGCTNVAPFGSCVVDPIFSPGALGTRTATMTITSENGSPVVIPLTGQGTTGYYQVTAKGKVANFGDAALFGDASGLHLAHPIVSIAPTGDNGGYWLAASDGGVFTFGDANFYGSTGALHLNKPIVGMAETATGDGYWLVASDGGIFSFGDAQFYGSTGAIHLNKPVVGMAVTPDGNGYWLVASDGGIFSFGDAQFYGSTGAIHLNKPVVGMAPTPDGRGYWLVASDGGIFTEGDAVFYGSAGNIHLNQPIVGMAPMADGGGYWFSAADGGLFNYGNAQFYGAGASQGLSNVVAMATDSPPTIQAMFDAPADRHALPAYARRS